MALDSDKLHVLAKCRVHGFALAKTAVQGRPAPDLISAPWRRNLLALAKKKKKKRQSDVI